MGSPSLFTPSEISDRVPCISLFPSSRHRDSVRQQRPSSGLSSGHCVRSAPHIRLLSSYPPQYTTPPTARAYWMRLRSSSHPVAGTQRTDDRPQFVRGGSQPLGGNAPHPATPKRTSPSAPYFITSPSAPPRDPIACSEKKRRHGPPLSLVVVVVSGTDIETPERYAPAGTCRSPWASRDVARRFVHS